ncbi:hypothetical protein QZH41_012663 [Actinostola sp. cb2023]|nr:hypothetical protein QZH41_012663 [Actinostola sp. cb2023]
MCASSCSYPSVYSYFKKACFLTVDAKGRPKKKLTKPRYTCVRNVCVRNIGQSGKFEIMRKGGNETNKMVIEFDSILEVDANGTIVGKKGGKDAKHSFKSFAPLDFEFTELVNVTYENVSAATFTFSVELPGPNASFIVHMYFFYDSGMADVCGEEEMDISPGMVKFNIEIANWDFCKNGTCTAGKNEEIGEYIDFTMTIKKKGKSKKGGKGKKGKGNKKMAQKFSFGNDNVTFPSYVEKDGSGCAQMPSGYPKFEIKGGNKFSLTFRFPKFVNKVFYDPLINAGAEDSSQIGGDGDSDVSTVSPVPTTESTGPQVLPSLGLAAILGVFVLMFF